MKNHVVDYCDTCKCHMIRCGTCNNNCCNAMYGQIDGKDCVDCPSAYVEQENNHFLRVNITLDVECQNKIALNKRHQNTAL